MKGDSTPPGTAARPSRRGVGLVYGALLLLIAGILFVLSAIDVYVSGASHPMGNDVTLGYFPWIYLLAFAVLCLGAGLYTVSGRRAASALTPAGTRPSSAGVIAHSGDRTKPAPRSTAGTTPATDEASLEPEEEDAWPETDLPPEPMPPHVILGEVDDIEASLRKRPPPSPPT